MIANKWVQAALVSGFCMGLWIGSWFAMVFSPWALFAFSYLFIVPSLYLTARARGSNVP